MKKAIFFPLVMMMIIATSAFYVNAQMGPGMGGWGSPGPQGQQGWRYCPYCGGHLNSGPGYGMGPGMMHGYGMGPGMMHGYGMGPGMMHGYGMGPGMMQGQGWGPGMHQDYRNYRDQRGPYNRQYGPQGYLQEPLDKSGAEQQVKNMLAASRNPNLKVGEITDKGDNFQVEVLTKKDGGLVDTLLVNKNTGAMRSIY